MRNVLKVSAVCVYDPSGRLLTVRKAGTGKFMHPGGKPEPGESAAEAGSRELAEETGIRVAAAELDFMGVWTGTAANESNTDIEATVFMAPGTWDAAGIHAAAEIAELRWMDIARAADFDDLAPLLTEFVLPHLTPRPSPKGPQFPGGAPVTDLPAAGYKPSGDTSGPASATAATAWANWVSCSSA